MKLSRRDFLKTSLAGTACCTLASTVPGWISKSAQAICRDLAGDRILVIVQLAGGNDGLNTVIPYTDPLYNGNTLRPTLHITSGLNLTTLDALNAFHPKLIRLTDWYTDGKLAIIQNVGYPNPDLSHFVATDYWEFGTSPGGATPGGKGWMARFVDNACQGVPPESIDALKMLAAGKFLVPATLNGSALYTPPAVLNASFYRISVPPNDMGDHILRYIEEMNSTAVIDPAVDFVQRSANIARLSVEDIQTASLLPEINPYPQGSLGDGLSLASKVIRAGFPTNVFYVSQGGYDTHANQFLGEDPINLGDHPRLLDTLDQALHAFLADMDASGNLDRVVVMTFSEFGRRVAENGSKGTDHGAANNLFVIGGPVKGGVYGGQPNLADLLSGNLKHTIDFRAVYARVLQDWLNADPAPIFGDDFYDPILDIQGGMAQIPIFEPKAPVPGDVNNDGKVDAADLQQVINVVIGADTASNGDANQDGAVTAADLQFVINKITKG